MEKVEKTILILWQDYLFLTNEMEKFLDKQELDMFFELLDQRGRLQSMIENRREQSPTDLLPEEKVLTEINQVNQVVVNKLQYAMNCEDKQHNIARAYEGYANNSFGMGMEWKS